MGKKKHRHMLMEQAHSLAQAVEKEHHRTMPRDRHDRKEDYVHLANNNAPSASGSARHLPDLSETVKEEIYQRVNTSYEERAQRIEQRKKEIEERAKGLKDEFEEINNGVGIYSNTVQKIHDTQLERVKGFKLDSVDYSLRLDPLINKLKDDMKVFNKMLGERIHQVNAFDASKELVASVREMRRKLQHVDEQGHVTEYEALENELKTIERFLRTKNPVAIPGPNKDPMDPPAATPIVATGKNDETKNVDKILSVCYFEEIGVTKNSIILGTLEYKGYKFYHINIRGDGSCMYNSFATFTKLYGYALADEPVPMLSPFGERVKVLDGYNPTEDAKLLRLRVKGAFSTKMAESGLNTLFVLNNNPVGLSMKNIARDTLDRIGTTIDDKNLKNRFLESFDDTSVLPGTDVARMIAHTQGLNLLIFQDRNRALTPVVISNFKKNRTIVLRFVDSDMQHTRGLTVGGHYDLLIPMKNNTTLQGFVGDTRNVPVAGRLDCYTVWDRRGR